MKFSRFKFSVLLNVIILTQPVNIVKRFFLFHQVFIKSMENFGAAVLRQLDYYIKPHTLCQEHF